MSKAAIAFVSLAALVNAEWMIANSNAKDWSALAASNAGKHVYAVAVSDQHVYRSEDYAQTWITPVATSEGNFTSLAVSDNGEQVYAAGLAHFYSSSDFGATWTEYTTGTSHIVGLSTSKTGIIVFAVTSPTSGSGAVLRSSDWGKTGTWSTVYTPVSTITFSAVACSADGKYVYAATNGDYLYMSSFYGNTGTWQQTGILFGQQSWSAITTSSDGKIIYASAYGYGLGRSTDFGKKWSSRQNANYQWVSVVADNNADVLYTAATGLYVYQSDESGRDWWYAINKAGTDSWAALAVSGDGTLVVAATTTSGTGYVYRRQTLPERTLLQSSTTFVSGYMALFMEGARQLVETVMGYFAK